MAKKRANGEGSIRKRSDGRWEGRYTAGYHSETGKRIIKNVLGKTQAECKAKLSAALESVKGIDVSRADEYTVATWLRSWYDIYAKPNIRVATADRYHLMVEQYTIPRIGNIKLTKLTARDLQKLYKELMENGRIDRKSGHGNPGLSSTTVRSLHLMLHNAFERAIKERLIPHNPTEDCIAPKIQKFEMQILQPEHIKEYLNAANARGLLPMFYLELVSGLRKGELTALLWSDLDIRNRTIDVLFELQAVVVRCVLRTSQAQIRKKGLVAKSLNGHSIFRFKCSPHCCLSLFLLSFSTHFNLSRPAILLELIRCLL